MLKGIAELIADRYGSKMGLLRYWLYHPSWRRYSWAQLPDSPVEIRRLVFVCMGNICRSALAMAIAEQYRVPAVSFGLNTRDGKEAAPAMIDAARAYGVALGNHSATRVEHYKPVPGDLVCLMEPSHLRDFLNHCEGEPPQLTLLGLWHPKPSAYIHDPLCCGEGYFRHCTEFLAECVRQIAHVAAPVQVENSSPHPLSARTYE